MSAPQQHPSAPKRSGSETRQRGRPVSVRLLPSERADLEMKASTAGMSMGSYLRACYLGSPGPRAKRRPSIDAVVLGHAVAQLNKAGSNLNQIARVLNTAGATVTTQETVVALAETRAAVAQIREIVGRKARA